MPGLTLNRRRRNIAIGALLVGTLLLVPLAILVAPAPPPAAYERIRHGMSRPEVEDLLGPSTAQAYDASRKPLPGQVLANAGLVAEQWEGSEATIHVDYDARTGQVVGKSLFPRNPVKRVLRRLQGLRHP
jgi:hypothetical protein